MSQIDNLLSLIKDYVDQDGPWKNKRDRLLQEASDDERTALLEFVDWFEGV